MMTITASYSYERQISYLSRGRVTRWQIIAGVAAVVMSTAVYVLFS